MERVENGLDFVLYFEHEYFLLELELLEVDFLFIGSEAKIRRMVLAAFKLFLRNGDAET